MIHFIFLTLLNNLHSKVFQWQSTNLVWNNFGPTLLSTRIYTLFDTLAI